MLLKIRNHNSLFAITVYFLLLATCSFSQQNTDKEIIAFSAGAGVLTFHGDVGSKSLVGAYSDIRTGYSFAIEKNISNNFSISLNAMKGKVAGDDKPSDSIAKHNFESPISQFGISATFFMRGKKEQTVIPFISAGISFISFDPHTDSLDKNGNPYYYWNDGSIRNLPETYSNIFYAHNIERDYTYETRLGKPGEFSRTSFAIPVSAGVKLKLSPHLDANIALTYHFAFTDRIDYYVISGHDNAYLYSNVSVTWHLFAMKKKDRETVSKVFAEIDKSDADGDGVKDADDQCPETPPHVKVDSKGCPLDSDGDGVPDYLDDEPGTRKGALVDTHGKEINTRKLKPSNQKAAARKAACSEWFNQQPSTEFLKEVEKMAREQRSNIPIPDDLKIADWNHDGFISSEEITKTIDMFFDGSIQFSITKMNRLIDFFFEQ